MITLLAICGTMVLRASCLLDALIGTLDIHRHRVQFNVTNTVLDVYQHVQA